ncbi:uncharacterized protein V6R79_023897 [Siganus canaliculatus]
MSPEPVGTGPQTPEGNLSITGPEESAAASLRCVFSPALSQGHAHRHAHRRLDTDCTKQALRDRVSPNPCSAHRVCLHSVQSTVPSTVTTSGLSLILNSAGSDSELRSTSLHLEP